jgi:hypothetical protein
LQTKAKIGKKVDGDRKSDDIWRLAGANCGQKWGIIGLYVAHIWQLGKNAKRDTFQHLQQLFSALRSLSKGGLVLLQPRIILLAQHQQFPMAWEKKV